MKTLGWLGVYMYEALIWYTQVKNRTKEMKETEDSKPSRFWLFGSFRGAVKEDEEKIRDLGSMFCFLLCCLVFKYVSQPLITLPYEVFAKIHTCKIF